MEGVLGMQRRTPLKYVRKLAIQAFSHMQSYIKSKQVWLPFFMDRVALSQGYKKCLK